MANPVIALLGLTYILFINLALPVLMWAGALFLITYIAKKL